MIGTPRMLGLATVPLLGLVLWFWAMFEFAELPAYLLVLLLTGYLLQYALFILVLGALVLGATRVDRAERFGLAVSLKPLPQLMGASWYLFVMGTGVIYLLFSMPPHIEYALPAVLIGLLADLAWALSIPVCLMQRQRHGAIASLARAFALARGNRWRLVAALVIATVPIVGLTILLIVLIGTFRIAPFLLAFGFVALSAVLSALVAVAYDRLTPPEYASAAIVFD